LRVFEEHPRPAGAIVPAHAEGCSMPPLDKTWPRCHSMRAARRPSSASGSGAALNCRQRAPEDAAIRRVDPAKAPEVVSGCAERLLELRRLIGHTAYR
jgi:hypothetical protein